MGTKKEKDAAAAAKLTEYRLEALRAQMNPHFMFNAITAIQSYILNNEKLAALSYLDEFASLIRKFLNHSRAQKITLSEEIELLVAYINLENMRFGDKFGFVLHIDEELDTENVSIPSMMIQPLVENAIKHGLMHKKGEYGLLQILFHYKDASTLTVTVEDNGIGRQKSAEINKWRPKEHKSVGLEIIAQRLQLLDELYSLPLGMTVEDSQTADLQPNGTKIILTLPIL